MQQTTQDVYLAIVARISESDTVETMQIGTTIPEIAKSKSVLDQNWSELLVSQVFDEMFRILAQVVKEKKMLMQDSTV